MNVSIYIFGEFASGYTQYPSDYTTDIFKTFYSNAKASTQLCIHRENDIMYYAYIRKLNGKGYIGICAVVNGLMFCNVTSIFNLFEQIFAGMVTRGELVIFDEQGNFTSIVKQLHLEREAIEQLQQVIRLQLDKQQTVPLPPISYGISKDSFKDFVIDDDNQAIIDAASRYGNTYIYKDKGYNTAQINSYQGVITRLKNEKDELQDRCDTLARNLTKEKIKQRNIKLVGILAGVVFIFGIILWNKVLFPSEVTHYETGEFIYYGPLTNGQPNGVGVAIYPENDSDGRRYYVGNFVNGKREDSSAMLLYKNGNYYYGALNEDKRTKGIDFNKSDNCHYEGTFINNQPYDGILYDHKKAYKYKKGDLKYAE